MNGLEAFFNARKNATGKAFERWLAPALILGVLAGLADAQVHSVARASSITNAKRPDVRGDYDVQFREAIQNFRDRGVVTPDEFDLLDNAAKSRAFSVGGLTDQYALETVKRSLATAIEDGTPVNTWLTQIEGKLGESGLDISEGAAHMRLVYRANVFGSYNAGRWIQQQRTKVGRPYLQRLSMAHGLPEATQVSEYNVRPEHAEVDGVIRPVDDGWWTLNYPPYLDGGYEYNCRCLVVSVSEGDMAREGLEVTDEDDLPASDASADDAQDPAESFFLGDDRIPTGAAGEDAYNAFLGN